MKVNKKYQKFYEIGNNRYYVLPIDNELYLATENFLELPKKFKLFKRELLQGFKAIELTPALLVLFNEIINADVEKEDVEFADMTTYKKVDNVAIRKYIEETYLNVLNSQIDDMNYEFIQWSEKFESENSGKMSEEDIEKIISANEKRVDENIAYIKEHSLLNYIELKKPTSTKENPVVRKMLDNNVEFLYTQKLGSSIKLVYLYELDMFGTITIYKVTCVKDVIKSIETFVYNRELLQELFTYIENNNL